MDQPQIPYNRRAGVVFTALSLLVVFLEGFALPGRLDAGYFVLLGLCFAVSLAISSYAGFRWQQSTLKKKTFPLVIRIMMTPPAILFLTATVLMCLLASVSSWQH